MSARVALTVGDPSGIGPEVAVKALAAFPQRDRVVLIGEARSLAEAIERYAPALDVDRVPLDDVPAAAAGEVSAAGGAAAMAALDAGIDRALAGQVAAIATGPINKAAVRAAGFSSFQGHTEYLAERAGVSAGVAMLLESERMSVVHVSTHRSLRSATKLEPQRLDRVIDLGVAHLRLREIATPRLLVAGLNPHAGEGRAFGDEDADVIAPAIERARDRHPAVAVEGPVAPDAVFLDALDATGTMVVAMYHDQGHIPSKLVARDSTVNITLGLPFVRTSVDHGTAHDIAGTGRADPSSMRAALDAALRLTDR
jgi:4-hydroxythreonine-4-phosphate dehydrogenase